MIFEAIATGGCRSCLIGCAGSFQGAIAPDGGMKAWRDAGYAVAIGQ